MRDGLDAFTDAFTTNAINQSIVRLAQPRRIFRDHVQHWLNVGRRTGDDAQNFTRRGLLLQRLLEFLEQTHVLDGDYGLVGEGFDEVDLVFREGFYLASP